MNVGIFGGTFDPPHTAHLIVAQDAASALRLDRVLFVPAAVPPHKAGRVLTDAPLRLRMLELAVADDERFAIEELELRRDGPSFTVDTLRELHRREPATAWALLVGADQYAEFASWREPAEIRRLARIGVLTREGRGVTADADGVTAVPVTRIDISSTVIRARVAAGQAIRYMVPAAVEHFIREQCLYVRNGPGATG